MIVLVLHRVKNEMQLELPPTRRNHNSMSKRVFVYIYLFRPDLLFNSFSFS